MCDKVKRKTMHMTFHEREKKNYRNDQHSIGWNQKTKWEKNKFNFILENYSKGKYNL